MSAKLRTWLVGLAAAAALLLSASVIFADTGSGTYLGASYKPGRVTQLSASFYPGHKSLFFIWKAPAGADTSKIMYHYSLRSTTGKALKSGKTSIPAVSIPKYALRSVARLRVRAYRKVGSRTYYGPWTSKWIVPQTFINLNTKYSYIKNGYLRLKWSKVTGATAYDIFVGKGSASNRRKVKTVSGKTTSTTIYSLAGSRFQYNTYYYIFIRTRSKHGSSDLVYGGSAITRRYIQ